MSRLVKQPMLSADQVTSSVIDEWQPPWRTDETTVAGEPLPPADVLKTMLETAFEASLLREENRPLRFRLLLHSPDRLPEPIGPPAGVHRFRFRKPRPLTAHELRRLTPAVDHDRSLVGVCIVGNNEPRIWGIVQSGSRWLQQFHGGRGDAFCLPDSLIVGVRDPGHMIISQGTRSLCAVEGGVLRKNGLNVFDSQWFPASFSTVRSELWQLHDAARAEWGQDWAALDPDFTRMVARQMIQRLISTIQRSKHGGTLLIVPADRGGEFLQTNAWIKLKYTFADELPRARVCRLIAGMMNALAAAGAHLQDDKRTLGWDDYGRAGGRELRDLDEALFEEAHTIATLTAVDGAVVVTPRFELLGFGAEIGGSLTEVPLVARALDLEGDAYRTEPTEDVGTRHRSVYRLVNALHDVLAIVVSQDGSARFVRWKDSQVMYWSHSTVTPR